MDNKDVLEHIDPRSEEERRLRLEALHQARRVQKLMRECHGSFPDGEAVRIVREIRDNFGE